MIKNYPKYAVSNKGRVKNIEKDFIMSCGLDRSIGYPVVGLYNEKGAQKHHVHRLVAEAFIPNPENKRTVNHIDCNKENNDVSNLEWANDSEQMKHAFSKGLCEKTRAQAFKNLTGKTRDQWTEEDIERARDRIIALNKRPKTERQLEVAKERFSSPEFRKLVEESHYNRHPLIRCVETGEVFRSQKLLAEHLNVCESAICAVLHGRRPAAGGYHFEYVDVD